MPGARVGSSPSNQHGPRLGLITCQRIKVQEGLGLSSLVMSHSARDATLARIFHFVSKILITWREARRTASPFFFVPNFFCPSQVHFPFLGRAFVPLGPLSPCQTKEKEDAPFNPPANRSANQYPSETSLRRKQDTLEVPVCRRKRE